MKKLVSLLLVVAMFVPCLIPAFAAVKTGDVDLNGKVEVADARLALRAAVSLETLLGDALKGADADFNGKIEVADARMILRAAVGLETLPDSGVHVHDYKVQSVDREPTCSNSGKQTVVCSCGDDKTEYIDALGHDYQLTKTEEPTCKVKGKNYYKCSRCPMTKTEYIDKVDHDLTLEYKAPGCETKGHNLYKCKNCTYVNNETLPATGHDYAENGLCKNCGNSDPSHYEEIPKGGTWVVADNWEISIVSVENHSLHSDGINESQGYTDEQCVMINYKVKNIGYKPHLQGATGLTVTPLDFNVYDETGEQAKNYVCNHTRYAQVEIKGLSATGTVPVVLLNDSETITFVIEQTDSNGVSRRAFFTADITG